MEPAGYHFADVCEREGRAIVFFYDAMGQRALTILEPNGFNFKSISNLKKILPTANLGKLDIS
jgi:hypothetical protein